MHKCDAIGDDSLASFVPPLVKGDRPDRQSVLVIMARVSRPVAEQADNRWISYAAEPLLFISLYLLRFILNCLSPKGILFVG